MFLFFPAAVSDRSLFQEFWYGVPCLQNRYLVSSGRCTILVCADYNSVRAPVVSIKIIHKTDQGAARDRLLADTVQSGFLLRRIFTLLQDTERLEIHAAGGVIAWSTETTTSSGPKEGEGYQVDKEQP